MLGLGSALTTGSAHEQMYSLILDGTGDLLNIGDNLDLGTGAFSISLWFNIESLDSSYQYLISKKEDDNNRIAVLVSNANKIQVVGLVGGVGTFSITGGSALTSDDHEGKWVHVAAVTDRAGAEAVYINGVTTTYGATAASTNDSANFDNTGPWAIGISDTSSGSGAFEGKIDEAAIFNVALDGDAVLAIYNGGIPFDLNNDRGSYDNASALQGYWRMGNGSFDDKADGVVHDAHNPGFGAELVTGNNSTFDGANDWVAYSQSGTTGISTTGGVLQVTLSGAGNGIDSGAELEMTSLLTAGKTYKIVFDLWLGTETVTTGWRAYIGGVRSDNLPGVSSTQTTFTVYIQTINTTDLRLYNTDTDVGQTGTFFIDNISVRELNGFPGITAADATFSTDTADD